MFRSLSNFLKSNDVWCLQSAHWWYRHWLDGWHIVEQVVGSLRACLMCMCSGGLENSVSKQTWEISMCIYIYVYIHVYLSMSISVCLYVYIFIYCTYIYIPTSISLYISSHIYIYISICIYLYISIYIYICVYIYIYTSICNYLCIYLYMWSYLCVYTCIYTYVFKFRVISLSHFHYDGVPPSSGSWLGSRMRMGVWRVFFRKCLGGPWGSGKDWCHNLEPGPWCVVRGWLVGWRHSGNGSVFFSGP